MVLNLNMRILDIISPALVLLEVEVRGIYLYYLLMPRSYTNMQFLIHKVCIGMLLMMKV